MDCHKTSLSFKCLQAFICWFFSQAASNFWEAQVGNERPAGPTLYKGCLSKPQIRAHFSHTLGSLQPFFPLKHQNNEVCDLNCELSKRISSLKNRESNKCCKNKRISVDTLSGLGFSLHCKEILLIWLLKRVNLAQNPFAEMLEQTNGLCVG